MDYWFIWIISPSHKPNKPIIHIPNEIRLPTTPSSYCHRNSKIIGKNTIISYELSSWIDDEGNFFSWGLETEIDPKKPCF